MLVITGPNTGGKTVALKTAALLALMAQCGLHVPAEAGSTLPVFRTIFADIGDEQSIDANLSTFSWHVTNIAAMDRALEMPALVLLDELGAGTDPVEGGALGMALVDHFKARGALVLATTHYDALKSYAATTPGVVAAAFSVNPETFAPTYRLIYGSPGASLALDMAARLGLPASIVAAARGFRTTRESQVAEHLARVDQDLQALDRERREVAQKRLELASIENDLRARVDAVKEREQRAQRKADDALQQRLRDARREIDRVVEDARAKAGALADAAASPRLVTRGGGITRSGAGVRRSRPARPATCGRMREPRSTPSPAGSATPATPATPARCCRRSRRPPSRSRPACASASRPGSKASSRPSTGKTAEVERQRQAAARRPSPTSS